MEEKFGKHIQNYTKKTGWAILVIAAAAFLSHGALLFSDSVGVDTEFMMEGIHNFDLLGRQGLIWLGYFLGLNSFSLYYAQALAFLFLTFAPVFFGFLFWDAGGQRQESSVCLAALGLSFVISPFWTAQLYFLNQSPQITFCCILIPLLLWMAEKARTNLRRKWFLIPLIILLMQPVFSSYQVLILLYITGAAALFLISSFQEERETKEQFQWILYHAVLFLTGFILYLAISHLFFLEGNNYLQGQIWWGRLEPAAAWKLCLDTLRGLCGYHLPYTTGFYPLFALVLLLLTGYQMFTKRRTWKGGGALFLLAELFLILSPCVFILLYGGAIPDRMQLILPFSQGCILYLLGMILLGNREEEKHGKTRWAGRILTLILAFAVCRDAGFQMSFCSRLYYTDSQRFQYDKTMAADIYREITALQDTGLYPDSVFRKIVFLGYQDIPFNDTCVRGNVIGLSEFEFDCFEKTIYRKRAISFMRQMGCTIDPYFREEEERAYWETFPEIFGSAVEKMPCYPHTGYVQVLSDDASQQTFLVIKLGEEWWFWDQPES